MSWSLHRWVWLLEAPLFVGAPPAGALNRCRPYVLSRGIWGALTSELAQTAANGFPDYRERGKILREDARFTYLYPAAPVSGAWLAWMPEYVPSKGLVWRREDHCATGDTAVPDRRFRRSLIDARPGTAIDPDSDSAENGSLRETECVMMRWRPGSPAHHDQVAFVGYVFLRGALVADLDSITTIFIGGDARYGLGRMTRIEFTKTDAVFDARVDIDAADPVVMSRQLLAHGITSRPLCGAKEALAGWDRTGNALVSLGAAHWTPGSRCGEEVTWIIDQNGIWNDSV